MSGFNIVQAVACLVIVDWMFLSFLTFLSFFLLIESRKYCAKILPSQSNGADGYFSASIENGRANYTYSLDLTHFNTGTCNLTKGLTYHFHTYWKNTSTTSGANGYCGTSYTGYHFDPNLACGPNSEDSKTGKCAALGRTSTSIPPYQYSCNTTNYQNGRYAFCETGDISNKFGKAYAQPSTRIFQQLTILTDYQPPYDANYKQGDALSYQWQSIVFHCAESNARLVCAEFVLTDEECGNSIQSSNGDNGIGSWSTGGWNKLAKLLVGLAVGIVGLGVVIGLIAWRKHSSQNRLL
jgi:hypothetical protein